MTTKTNITKRLDDAFARFSPTGDTKLFVVRRDGLMVWEKKAGPQSQALAALCSGVWEAAFAMAQAAGTTTAPNGFRLVFDDAAAGVLVFPLTVDSTIYYLGSVYSDCTNPGRLRRQIQNLRESVEENLKSTSEARTTQTKLTSEREGYLFKDITDAEMDRLFGA